MVIIDSIESSDKALNLVAFGSCNRQYKDQGFWGNISSHNPELWVTSGDSYYTNADQWKPDEVKSSKWTMEAVVAAMNQARSDPNYQAFLEATKFGMVGTYDDHDFGVNDGGGGEGELYEFGVVDKKERQQVFLDFMNLRDDDTRRQREGVYAAHMYGPPDQRIKVIALDTRYHRTAQLIPSLGYRPLIGAAARIFTAGIGASVLQTGTLLGEEQWTWFEEQLAHSAESGVKINLIVSSIQVLTGNPFFESWSHYPGEQTRFIETLAKYQPSGALVLSGDIHLAELLSSGADSTSPLEVTSSGLSHSCMEKAFVPDAVCVAAMWLFSDQRWHKDSQGLFLEPSFTARRNFGTIDVDWTAADGVGSLNVSVWGIDNEFADQPPLFSFSRLLNETGGALPPAGENWSRSTPLAVLAIRAILTLMLAWFLRRLVRRVS